MSNKYRKARGIILRPKVCKSKIPTPGSTPTTTCSLSPSTATISIFETLNLLFIFFDSLRPEGEPYDIETFVNIGTITLLSIPENGIALDLIFEPMGEIGEAQIDIRAQSVSGSDCQKTSIVQVTA